MSISVREQWTRIGHSQTVGILGSNEKAKASAVQDPRLLSSTDLLSQGEQSTDAGQCLPAMRKNKQSPNPHTQSLAKTKDGQGNRNSLYHSPTSLAPSNKRHQSTADGEATHIDTASLWHGYDGASQSRWYSRNTEKDLLVPQTPLSGQVNSRPTAKGIWSLWCTGVMISPKK